MRSWIHFSFLLSSVRVAFSKRCIEDLDDKTKIKKHPYNSLKGIADWKFPSWEGLGECVNEIEAQISRCFEITKNTCHSEVVRMDEESSILRITNWMRFWDKSRMTKSVVKSDNEFEYWKRIKKNVIWFGDECQKVASHD